MGAPINRVAQYVVIKLGMLCNEAMNNGLTA